MGIQLLSNETIDKIAAGEVVEKPLNVVKELVENSIDSGATHISVEIKGGGIDLIRVSDDGSGIVHEDCEKAFLRHATSKLRTIEDLDNLSSLGFRGEALSSISAVSKCELITKTRDSLLGTHISVLGGKLEGNEEIGAPNGTTVVVRQLFYNTPARRKFLKSPTAEGASIEELMGKIALSNPTVSFSFILNGKTKIHTPGNGELSDVIFNIYGREIYNAIIPVDFSENGVHVSGYMAKPEFTYQARNGEVYFVNGRYVKSKVVQTAIEEGYRGFLMQHRFPFCVIFIDTSKDSVDVNVHPQKMDVRFSDNEIIRSAIINAFFNAIKNVELIPEADADTKYEADYLNALEESVIKEPEVNKPETVQPETLQPETLKPETYKAPEPFEFTRVKEEPEFVNEYKEDFIVKQESLFEKKLINDAPLKRYTIIGQVFDTYWLITLDDDLYIVDQHAAHEKVNYELFMGRFLDQEGDYGQTLLTPIILSLSPQEKLVLSEHMALFNKLGFDIEDFGDNSFALRTVPTNLYGIEFDELFHSLLNELTDKEGAYTPQAVIEKLASKACKASIKAGMRVSFAEMEELMNKLMKLKNPYNCPHGRPTFIKITKYELEKKFKRIV